jgi:hypothetical protein
MSFCKKVRIYMPLKNGPGKKVTTVRQELTGDWKGIPPHITLLEIELGECVSVHGDELVKLVQEFASEYVKKIEFELCDAPNDVKQFKIFTALRYNILGESIQSLYDQIVSAILKCAGIDGDLAISETDKHIEFSHDGKQIYAVPLYARDLSLLKGHISVSVTGKITVPDAATEVIRSRLSGVLHHLSFDHFSEVKVEVIDNR